MTQNEQKPESAELRAREDQIETMTVHYMEAGFPINAARSLARDGVAEMMSSGAAEQRRKDAEGCIQVHQYFMGGFWNDCSPEMYANQPYRRVLYTRPANVAALEAEIRALKAQLGAMQHGAVRQVVHSPLRHFKPEDL